MKIVVPPLVVARVDDEVHRLLDPLRGLLRAEIVEHEQSASITGRRMSISAVRTERVVGAADDAQQIADVVEQPARASVSMNDVPQNRDREVRLADAGRADQAQALARLGKCVGESPRAA